MMMKEIKEFAFTLLVVMVVLFAMAVVADDARAARASCYGPGLWGNSTADGTTLRRSSVGIAHRTASFQTWLYVRFRGRTVKARVFDRGPFVSGRSLDLTQRLVQQLGVSNCTQWGDRRVRSWVAPPG